MMERLLLLVSGLCFGAGVTVSGMVNPTKVLNFMDIAGTWDPTLLFVMGAGLVATFIGYRVVFRRQRPLYDSSFRLPASKSLDARLIGGGALFGLGWGLTGFCPGPAIAGLVFLNSKAFVFAAAMATGMILVRIITDRRTGLAAARGD